VTELEVISWNIFFTTTNQSAIWTSANRGPSWSWSYGNWIYNCLCNQCLSPLNVLRSNPAHC